MAPHGPPERCCGPEPRALRRDDLLECWTRPLPWHEQHGTAPAPVTRLTGARPEMTSLAALLKPDSPNESKLSEWAGQSAGLRPAARPSFHPRSGPGHPGRHRPVTPAVPATAGRRRSIPSRTHPMTAAGRLHNLDEPQPRARVINNRNWNVCSRHSPFGNQLSKYCAANAGRLSNEARHQ